MENQNVADKFIEINQMAIKVSFPNGQFACAVSGKSVYVANLLMDHSLICVELVSNLMCFIFTVTN